MFNNVYNNKNQPDWNSDVRIRIFCATQKVFKISNVCAPYVPAGYFCRTPQSMIELCAIR